MKIEGASASEAAPTPSPQLSNELRHQRPLCAAGILKFVDQHMAILRFEPKAALRELVHVFEQLDRPFEHTGKIEQRMRIERSLILARA